MRIGVPRPVPAQLYRVRAWLRRRRLGRLSRRRGHPVVGVDINALKVDLVNQGRSPMVEAGLDEDVAARERAGRLHATTDCDAAVAGTDIGLVCVSTPSRRNGSLDRRYRRRMVGEIGRRSGALARGPQWSSGAPSCRDEPRSPPSRPSSGPRAGR